MKLPDSGHNPDADDSLEGFLESPICRWNPVSNSLEGTTIEDRYVVERELGHSMMSQIYLARDLRLQGQEVVVKILSEALFEDAEARQRFDNELKILLRLEHPNVIGVKDRGELADGRPYLVMAYVDGETLRSQIPPNTGMDLERAASILKQIGAALDYIHENNVFHRDLKPENIMLRRGTDSVVLIDFGIAKVNDSMSALTAKGTLAGTIAYMSPEQLNGQRITAASDVYSLGVVSYEMLTGRRPFNPESPWQLPELQRAGVPVRPRDLRAQLSPKAQRIIMRALSFEPKARCKTAGEFSDKLAQALREDHPPSPPFPKLAGLIGSLVLLPLLTFGIYKICTRRVEAVRSFQYSLTVQKMLDGKEYQAPFQSNGQETFANGDRFRLNVSSPTAAYLYIFNQGPPDTTDTSFVMIYPNAATNRGASSIGANQPFQSNWITFRGPAGTENFWFVWSVSPVTELEAAKGDALNHPRGGLTGDSLLAVKEFLRTKQAEFKTTTFHYEGSQTAFPRGKTDTLIAQAQFKHR